MWVLGIKPGSLGEQEMLLSARPSLHPIVHDSSEYIPLTRFSGGIYLAKNFPF